jgi:hypothetical protein
MDLGASATHERMKQEAVEEAAAVYARAARDRAVRAAVLAGVPSAQVAQAAACRRGGSPTSRARRSHTDHREKRAGGQVVPTPTTGLPSARPNRRWWA